MNNIQIQVIQLLIDELNIAYEEVNLTSSLFHDLGVDGDDASDLLERFSKEFNVDISNFKFNDYFGSEVSFVFKLFFPFSKKSFKKLTVQDLIIAAEKGKLE